MKLKRLVALGLSLALTLSLAVVPAQAATFADIENHWAKDYIEEMAALGYAKGDGVNFHPDSPMAALEVLLFCARLTGVDQETQDRIAADRWDEVTPLLPPSRVSWAGKEVAVAVETGVISLTELEALGETAPGSLNYSGGAQSYLLWNVSRENVCMYLVRAMQLEPLVRSIDSAVYGPFLSSYYADAANITPALQPYIYILTLYGIFTGIVNQSTGVRTAAPKNNLKRAEMMALMCRAQDVMESRGIRTELSEYTDYPWVAGKIVGATTALDGSVILTLQSDITGTESYALPATAKIYDDYNMLADTSFLRNGKYVRLNLDGEGAVESARLSGTVTSYKGSVSSLEGNRLILSVDGVNKTYTMTRFTQVMAGSQVGDRTVIDYDAGYTDATCYVDSLGNLVGVILTGGTVEKTGLIAGVNVNALTGSVTLAVADRDGTVSNYAIPTGIAVTVNGALGQLLTSHVGRCVSLRLSEETKQVTTVAVDTLTAYIQGRLVRQSTSKTDKTLTITIANSLDSDRESAFPVDPAAVITYQGEERTISQIENGWFVTARVANGSIVELEGFPATTTVEGVLASITRGTTTVLNVLLADGSTVTYPLELGDLSSVSITRGGKNSGVDALRTGDTLVITLRYHVVSKIEATPVAANLKGQIAGINNSLSARSIDVTLEDGTVATYTVGQGVSVTKGGYAASFKDLNPGDAVALVTNGNEVLSIEITAVASTEGVLTGTVYTINTLGNSKSFTLLLDDNPQDPVTVDVKSGSGTVPIQDTKGTKLTLHYGLVEMDRVMVYGSYNGATFVATMVIKLPAEQ